ncbi:hypothetical protein B4Q13_19725 [Lacticaseibacillus rhamnosus]
MFHKFCVHRGIWHSLAAVGFGQHDLLLGLASRPAQGRFRDAYLTARRPNPFASICGRVCAAPCEAACRRGTVDAPVSIRALSPGSVSVAEQCAVNGMSLSPVRVAGPVPVTVQVPVYASEP